MNAESVGRLLAGLSLVAAVTAAAREQQPGLNELVAASLPAEYCFTSGSATGPDYMKFCVSPRAT
jgi:hypothetical protein